MLGRSDSFAVFQRTYFDGLSFMRNVNAAVLSNSNVYIPNLPEYNSCLL
uniref:Uncharacterized protein n=1 Tax=Anguilla anguilla TaxID=7936 RepID=A0A0E9VV17_ANGAN